jgi:hypothetical protein
MDIKNKIMTKFMIIAVLFSGGFSENTPATDNIAKNPPRPINTISAIIAKKNHGSVAHGKKESQDLSGVFFKTVISLIRKRIKNNMGIVTKISLPKDLLNPFGFSAYNITTPIINTTRPNNNVLYEVNLVSKDKGKGILLFVFSILLLYNIYNIYFTYFP